MQVGAVMGGLKELLRGPNLVVLFLKMWAVEVSSISRETIRSAHYLP